MPEQTDIGCTFFFPPKIRSFWSESTFFNFYEQQNNVIFSTIFQEPRNSEI